MESKVIVLVVSMGIGGMAAQANELSDGPCIVISGTASVDAVSGIATLAIGVNVTAKDATIAKKQADEHVVQYILFPKPNQITKKDISPTNLRTQPDYDYQDGKSILKGYRTVRTVEVALRQLDKLDPLLDGVLKVGPNEVYSVLLGVVQPDVYKDKARKAAVDNTTHQAQELVNGFYHKLRSVYSVRHHTSNYQPSPMARMMKANAAPVSAQGTYEQAAIQFDDQVDVVFQLKSVDQQPAKTLTVQQYLWPDVFIGLMSLFDIASLPRNFLQNHGVITYLCSWSH